MRNYYEILEVNENASQELIELAYQALLKKYNPTIQPPEKVKWVESELKQIEEAYYVLSNPDLREQYDLKHSIKSYRHNNNLYEEKQKNDSLNNNSRKKKNGFFKKRFEKSSIASVVKEMPSFREVIKAAGTALYNETQKPKKERSRDLIALIITVVIIGFFIFLFVKIPAINKILFPEFN